MILSAFLWFKALPRGFHYLALGVVAVLAFLAWDHFDDRAAVKRDRAEQAAKVQERAIEAERASAGVVQASQAATASRTEAAREAARHGDDPLRAGLESLQERR